MTVGLVDLALGRPVVVSSGEDAAEAVDGDYHSSWSSDKSDDEWIYVDLGQEYAVDRVEYSDEVVFFNHLKIL